MIDLDARSERSGLRYKDIALMGFDSAFMHRPKKLAMIEQVKQEIEALTAGAA